MKLPEIFKNKIKNPNNNQNVYISKEESNPLDNLPSKVLITTNKGETFKTTIINRTTNYLITKDRRVLSLSDITDIKKI